jgi:hypothetical protein
VRTIRPKTRNLQRFCNSLGSRLLVWFLSLSFSLYPMAPCDVSVTSDGMVEHEHMSFLAALPYCHPVVLGKLVQTTIN